MPQCELASGGGVVGRLGRQDCAAILPVPHACQVSRYQVLGHAAYLASYILATQTEMLSNHMNLEGAGSGVRPKSHGSSIRSQSSPSSAKRFVLRMPLTASFTRYGVATFRSLAACRLRCGTAIFAARTSVQLASARAFCIDTAILVRLAQQIARGCCKSQEAEDQWASPGCRSGRIGGGILVVNTA